MTYQVRPITRNAATGWVAEAHRHLRRPVTGWLFGVEVLRDGERVEITRVAMLEGHPNACSFAYGALRRAARELGYQRVITYTRADEAGVSPKAAGFRCDGMAGGGEASRPSRPRKPSEDPSPKVRWVWP